ncbi:bifunctional 5,10-methylenetetrahydrofolate dehydrogenase/5,10-methenyltetrahydrofolate cyclohydrolase [soil metagenome]
MTATAPGSQGSLDSLKKPGTLILRGGELAIRLRKEIREATAHLYDCGGALPKLATVCALETPAAQAYRRSIVKTLDRVGLLHDAVDLPPGADSDDLRSALLSLSADRSITGVLVLMPLPESCSVNVVNEYLDPMKDVDGITPANAGRLHLGLPCLAPSTPQGGIAILDQYDIAISGARAVVVGRSNVVGRPLSALLMQRDATVTICHSKTHELSMITSEADIVAVATGNARWLSRSYVKAGATVLDFGINVVEEKVVGDADYSDLVGHAGAITPVPGGTGPVTALILARNTVAAAFAQLGGTMDSLSSAFDEFSLANQPGRH